MAIIIHVNRNLIARNRRDGGKRPVYAVREGRRVTYAHGVTIKGTLTFIDPRAAEPLPCGATIYAIAEGEVILTDPTSFKDIEDGKA